MKKHRQFSIWITIVFSVVLAIFFQNCSEFSAQNSFLYQQAIEQASQNLDNQVLIGLQKSSEIKVWNRPNNQDSVTSMNSMMADQWTVIATCDTSLQGDLVKVNSGEGSEESYLGIYNGKIRAGKRVIGSGGFEEYVQADIPLRSGNFIVSASYGANSNEIKLLINGRVVMSPLQVLSGQPYAFSFIEKTVVVSDANKRKFEIVVFSGDSLSASGALGYKEMNSFSRFLARENNIQNVVFDPILISMNSNNSSRSENPNFLAAKAVIDQKCVSCHYNGGQGTDFANLTENKAIRLGLVDSKGSLANSKLYYRLRGSTGGPANALKNMPEPNGSATLSTAEFAAISKWIQNISTVN